MIEKWRPWQDRICGLLINQGTRSSQSESWSFIRTKQGGHTPNPVASIKTHPLPSTETLRTCPCHQLPLLRTCPTQTRQTPHIPTMPSDPCKYPHHWTKIKWAIQLIPIAYPIIATVNPRSTHKEKRSIKTQPIVDKDPLNCKYYKLPKRERNNKHKHAGADLKWTVKSLGEGKVTRVKSQGSSPTSTYINYIGFNTNKLLLKQLGKRIWHSGFT